MDFDLATLQPGQICINLCVLATFSVAAIGRIQSHSLRINDTMIFMREQRGLKTESCD